MAITRCGLFEALQFEHVVGSLRLLHRAATFWSGRPLFGFEVAELLFQLPLQAGFLAAIEESLATC